MAQRKASKSKSKLRIDDAVFVSEVINGLVDLSADVKVKRTLRKMAAPVRKLVGLIDELAGTKDGQRIIEGFTKGIEDKVLENAKALKYRPYAPEAKPAKKPAKRRSARRTKA